MPDTQGGMIACETISCVGLSEILGQPVRKPHGTIAVCEGEWRPMFSLSRRCVGYRFWKHGDLD